MSGMSGVAGIWSPNRVAVQEPSRYQAAEGHWGDFEEETVPDVGKETSEEEVLPSRV